MKAGLQPFPVATVPAVEHSTTLDTKVTGGLLQKVYL
jgi:hypothetical protein